jgi:DNA-binding NarL/FixJ family response regulator
LIVDRYEPWRRTLRIILEECPKWQIIWEALDGLEAVRKSQELQPDLILLEIGLAGLNGIEAARRIRNVAPHAKIVFLSDQYGPELVREALKVGRWGYILKADAAHDLLPALAAILQNKQFISRTLTGISMNTSTGASTDTSE